MSTSTPVEHKFKDNLRISRAGAFQYLIVDIFALWSSAGLQDVVVITVVNNEDSSGSDHTGDILKGQLLVTLVP